MKVATVEAQAQRNRKQGGWRLRTQVRAGVPLVGTINVSATKG